MIPVTLQPEPDGFDEKVRQKGHAWLRQNGIALDAEPPATTKLKEYWREYNYQLWEAYSGVCAYLAIYFEYCTGSSSTDHFVAKSRNAGAAYEWSNYRLSCLAANRNKNRYDDVLDPVGLQKNTFFINFASGEVFPNPDLSPDMKTAAEKSIRRLRLNAKDNSTMRIAHYENYQNGDCSLSFLRKHSPFVCMEIERQGLQREES
ncbi:MAG: hypothetical protein IJU76_06345 [Desulfovibrionaceae bacterium]|nr:hypothetical protein [Desulfovibrionaceae bacterium]